MTNAKTIAGPDDSRRSEEDLDRRYGRIAISALVAALPYGGETKAQTSEDSESRKGRAA
ncbi:hypothetical protein [Pseudorhodoplanes sp.]|uniref:hypothetical protein n=1 Tax=Pseudorhodoplanes sp. TaxID=1934341 RepID=UPI002B6E889A|nr:hypothetical protein [Pseudorhodoplanes sp.]HWV55610.1 hypothetical protein [Pseudorhodoplanes sp.]